MNVGKKSQGFTIVELLIVIVVIGILAAITIVAFNGVQNKAKASALQSTLSQLAKKMESSRVVDATGAYPANLAAVNVTAPSGYTYSTTATGTGYCLVGVNGDLSYYVTNTITTPKQGSCVTVDGLLAWWPFDGDTNDVSGNNIESTPVDVSPVNGQNGQANGAYSFNGTDSQVVCGKPDALKPTTAVSVSAWVNLAEYGGGGLSGFVNYGGGGYWLYASGTGGPTFYVSSGALGATMNLSLNQWYLVTGTFTAGQRIIYVNGNQVALDVATGIANVNNYSSETCQIGSIKNVANRFMGGKLDDVRIYNRVLTASEVQALYAAGAQ